MKNLGFVIGLIVLCLLKATLVWTIWCCVVGALALIGAARCFGAGATVPARAGELAPLN